MLGDKIRTQPLSPRVIRVQLPEGTTHDALHLELERLNEAARLGGRLPPFRASFETADHIHWLQNKRPLFRPRNQRSAPSGLSSSSGEVYIGGLNPLLSMETISAALSKLGIAPTAHDAWVRPEKSDYLLLRTTVRDPQAFYQRTPITIGPLSVFPKTTNNKVTWVTSITPSGGVPKAQRPEVPAYEPPREALNTLEALREALRASPLRPVEKQAAPPPLHALVSRPLNPMLDLHPCRLAPPRTHQAGTWSSARRSR